MNTSQQFAAPPPRVNWPARVAQKLAALPRDGWTAADDLALIERVSRGGKLAVVTDRQRERVVQFMAICRDDADILSLDGRAALLAELRRRAA